MRAAILGGVVLGVLCCSPASSASPAASQRTPVATLAQRVRTASRGSVRVEAAYRVGPAVSARGKACPLSIRGSALRCTPASEIGALRIGVVRPFYHEQHGFLELGCVKQPCLFTWAIGEDIAQVPKALARGIDVGGSVLVLMTHARDGQQVKSYVFSADSGPDPASCLYPAPDDQLTGEDNRRGCDLIRGLYNAL